MRMGQAVEYPAEHLGEDEDDGTMPDNVDTLREAVVGHRIVSAEKGSLQGERWGDPYDWQGLVLTLDNGRRVCLSDTDDCCAYTELREFLLHPELVDHVIVGVGTTDGFERWHIFADAGDVLELTVGWSAGNPFYYGYGFEITVRDEVPDGS
jgi:hypothetical protein